MRIMVLTAGTEALFWFRMDMMKALIAKGHDVIAVGAGSMSQWAPEFAKPGITYRQMRVARTGTNPFQDIDTIKSIRELIREEHPDLLFTFHGKGNIYGNMAAHAEGLERVYSSVEGLGNVLAPSLANEKDPKLVRRILMTEYRMAFRHVKKVFFVNDENRDFFIRHKIIDEARAVITDGIGVNLNRFAPHPIPKDECPLFLFSGRLLKSKGVLDFARAARIVKRTYPDVQVKFVAIGPFESGNDAVAMSQLRTYIDHGDIEYAGSQHDVRPYLARCTALVLPSFYNEGLPKSIMEAMATGRPIITTDTVGCRLTVSEGINGFLIDPKNPQALADRMKRLIDDPKLAVKMGAESRRIAEDRFDVRRINDFLFKQMGLD